MRFSYCPDCGSPLGARDLGDDCGVPWCDSCGRPWFPVFPSAIIALVYNDSGEVLLLRQDYISTEFRNLVSGYIAPGENAESCAVREIYEETGLVVDRLELVFTDWFARKEIMMIGFFAHVNGSELRLSAEVDSAEWVSAGSAPRYLSTRPGSTSRRLVMMYLDCKKN